jgi:hypothetical protein
MTDWGVRTRQIGTFQLTVKILEFLPEGSGTGFLHKKRVPEIFPLPSSPGLPAEQKKQSIAEKRVPRNAFSLFSISGLGPVFFGGIRGLLVDPIFFEFVLQSPSSNPQNAGGAGTVSVIVVQCYENQFPLHFF